MIKKLLEIHGLPILLYLIFIGLVFPFELSALTPPTPRNGDPTGSVRALLRLQDLGSDAENESNYHVCATPAYSQIDWLEEDGKLGGASGSPTPVSASALDLASLNFTRANQEFVELIDKNGSCGTSNNPFDHTGSSDYFMVSAWINPDSIPDCSYAGQEFAIASKWDGSSNCSWRIVLKTVDTNGAPCIGPAELEYHLRAYMDDAGGTFSCGTPCEAKVEYTNDIIPQGNNLWTHVMAVWDPVRTPSTFQTFVNGAPTSSLTGAESCQSGTNIPDQFSIKDSSQNVFVGENTAGGTSAFQGKISDVQIVNAPDKNFQRIMNLNHMNLNNITDIVGGDDPYLTYGYLNNATIDSTNKRYGESVYFNGTDASVPFINRLLYNNPDGGTIQGLVVEAWIRPENAQGAGHDQTIASRWEFNDDVGCTNGTDNSAFRLFLDSSGHVNFWVMDDTNATVTVSGITQLQDNQWYHVAGILTGDTSQYLVANRLFVFVDGISDTVTPGVFNNPARTQTRNAYFNLGANYVEGFGTTCASGPLKDFFQGNIDEVRVNIPSANKGIEAFNPGVVLNEVNFYNSISGEIAEEIELYVFPDLGHSIDLYRYTLGICSQAAKDYVFDNAVSKVVDPGDLITIVFDPPSVGSAVDTSCNDGIPSTCTWHTINTSSGTALQGGDVNPSRDGVIFYQRSNPSSDDEKFASAIDAVIWGLYQGSCQDNVAADGRGLWEARNFMEVGTILDDTRSLCLKNDGDNESGSTSWAQCDSTIGALNSSMTTAIQLLSFKATLTGNTTQISWETGSENNVLGFNLLRADNPFDIFKPINLTLIDSQGWSGSGANYDYTDFNTNKIYYYKLEEVEVTGIKNVYGPFAATSTLATHKSTANDPNASPNVGGGTLGSTSSSNNYSASGCGAIASSENGFPAFLSFLMIVVMMLTTKTYWIQKRF